MNTRKEDQHKSDVKKSSATLKEIDEPQKKYASGLFYDSDRNLYYTLVEPDKITPLKTPR